MRHLLSKKEIIIDLTSLLDVIFIVLMVVMFGQTVQKSTVEQDPQDSQALVSTPEDFGEESVVQHYQKYENIDNYVTFIDVRTEYIPDSFEEKKLHERYLTVTAGIGDGQKTLFGKDAGENVIIVSEENEDDVFKGDGLQPGKLEQELRRLIDSSAAVGEDGVKKVVVVSVNRNEDKILYRDEVAISKLLEDLASEYKEKGIAIAVQ